MTDSQLGMRDSLVLLTYSLTFIYREVSDDEVSNGSDDLVLPAVTVLQPTKQLPSGYWDEENARLKQFGRCLMLYLVTVIPSICMYKKGKWSIDFR